MTNAFIIDCEYVSGICEKFRTDFSTFLKRTIPEADLARWIECALLDCSKATPLEKDQTQVYLFHEKANSRFMHFVPTDYNSQIDGKAFKGAAGEFLLAACTCDETLGSKETLLCETLQNLLKHNEQQHIIVAADLNAYGKRIKSLMADSESDKVVFLSINPSESKALRIEQIGFSLLAALSINSQELEQLG